MSDVKNPAGRAALRAVCEAATPGPWVTEETPRLGGSVNALLDGLWRQVAEASGQAAMFDTRATTGEIQQANARFMALARTALPEALEYIERLEREVVAAERKSIDNASHFAALGVLTATPQEALRAAFPEMQARIADLERELADTRKAHEILEASAVADLEKLARAAAEEARSRADLWKEAVLGRSGIEAAYEAGRAAGKAEAGELDDPRAPCDTSGLNDG